ncbi:glycosyltransferase 87 family protein [Cellulomonas citrea]|uniref:glycosyltransferase 87 family protein n=1 Tax=Cellulomonas citrea TaxID=1909423 RepID=UPI001358EE7B|nr:glycosyltransferase 87 family protein [Cellulomonas citrea]
MDRQESATHIRSTYPGKAASHPEVTLSSRLSVRRVWIAFGLVHLLIALQGVLLMPDRVFWDLDLYRAWVWYGVNLGTWPVFTTAWVYPVGALVPMVLVGELAGHNDMTFRLGWAVMVTILNALAMRELLRRRNGLVGAAWFVAFLFALGPVSVGRLDALVAPLSILALLALAKRPRVAAVLLTVGAWIKVAPGALLLPIVLATKRPLKEVIAPAALLSAGVVAVVALLGGAGHVASFLFAQGGRGLQLESVGASPWLLVGLVSSKVSRMYNSQIITYEVHGPGVPTLINVLDIVFGLALIAATWLMWRRRTTGPNPLPAAELVARGSLLVVLTMLVTNKVLSPQYITWLAAPVAVALALGLPHWDRTARWMLGIALATQVVFPWVYGGIIGGGVPQTLVLVGRNVALVLVWLATARRLVRQPSEAPARQPELAGSAVGSAAV